MTAEGAPPARTGALTRPRGNRVWDRYLRSTGVLGVVGIAVVLALPVSGPLVGLLLYTLWVTGPLSPFFPVGLEPVVMLWGRLYPPLLVAAAVTAASLYVEFVTYHLYRTMLRHRATQRLRESRFLHGLRRYFERAPFATIWVLSWSPIPYWGGRIMAAHGDYSIARYLLATLLGRLPKFWLFAALGLQWEVSAGVLVTIVVAGTLLSLALLLARR